MKSGRSLFGLLLIVLYLFFPGNGLAFANHLLHDNGLKEIECLCCTETEKSAGQPLTEHGDDSDVPEADCACASHIPLAQSNLGHSRDVTRLPLFEPAQTFPEMFYPIFVPPQNPTA